MNSTLASSFSRKAWERNAPAYEAIREIVCTLPTPERRN
jgi:hypothetical protein